MTVEPTAGGGDAIGSRADELLAAPLHGLRQEDKDARLSEALAALTQHHRAACAAYRRITDVLAGGERRYARLAELPWLPVGLFRSHELRSVPAAEVVTTVSVVGGGPSAGIHLDRATAARSTRAIERVARALLGAAPLPMLMIERGGLVAGEPRSARAGGIRALSALASEVCFALDAGGELDQAAVEGFLATHGARPFAMVGHTASVWEQFYPAIASWGLDLSHGTLLHSGGRRRLTVQVIDNATLKAKLATAAGLTRIHNVYGLGEQPGAVLVEGEDGLLYPPAFADVVIRDPMTFDELPTGKAGVVQMVSALPTSYPGHSLLTEDLGVVERVDVDVCGRLGKAVRIIGRAPHHRARGAGEPFPGEVAP